MKGHESFMKKNKPNMIWIMSDQQPNYMLSCNGDINVNTPNLDLLAAYGLNFRRAVGGSPLCCPFRGSMMTSVYPHKCVPAHQAPLPAEMPTVVRPFKEAGYHTAYIGKWHLDGWKESDGRSALHIVPPERRCGFDYWAAYENNNSQYDCWVHGGEGDEAFHYRLPGYETDELTNLMLSYIDRQTSDTPFFAVLSVQPPHNPYTAPPEYMAKHNPAALKLRDNVPDIPGVRERTRRDLAGAYAMVENLDMNVGRIMRKLSEKDMQFDTHIMFFSDHGDMHGSHGLRLKTNPYNESVGIPFIIGGAPSSYGGAQGHVRNHPINHVDIAPTSLGLCGIDIPDWMEGTDYSGLRRRDKKGAEYPDSAYLQIVVPTMHGDSMDKPWRGILTADGWKYVCFEGIVWLMFDTNSDPYEQVNLAHNTLHRQKRKQLNDRLKKWIEDTGDNFELPEY